MLVKKILIWFMLMVLTVPNLALAQENAVVCQQGDTFEAMFALTPDSECPDGIMGQLEYDNEIFIPISPDITMRRNKDGSMNAFVFMHGKTISVSFQVNRYAPDGLYTIGIKVLQAVYADGSKTDQVKIIPVQVRIGPVPTSISSPTPTPEPTPTSTVTPNLAAVAPEMDFEYEIKDGKATITKYKGPGGNVIIPDVLNEYSVTSIGYRAFSVCRELTSVTIPNSVTSIGEEAFSACIYLTSVTIPNSVTSIGGGAFFACKSLPCVMIPNSVTSIGGDAFSQCSNLISINVESNNIVFSSVDGILYNNNITTLIQFPGGLAGTYTIPDGVKFIESCAFRGCSGLTSVSIPNSVSSVGAHAFLECSNLTSINVESNNMEYFSVDGVLYNKDITALIIYPGGLAGAYTIPDSVTSIYPSAFISCRGLTSVTIPNSVTSIGVEAFSGCSSLTSVTIPDSVTSIGPMAFDGCSGLTSVTIPASVTSIGRFAFSHCSSLTSVTIPNSVTSIEPYTFCYCSSLTSVTIPDSVSFIEVSAFFECSKDLIIYVSQGSYALNYCQENKLNYKIQ